ncbi:mitochondrial inner membrane i-AAA protease complex subunit Mgr1p [Diutina catenulata]
MGYIPPPDEPAGSKPPSSSRSDVITIAIPRNPSVGLVWGPLVPASDNRPALWTAIGVQLFIGVWSFSKARQIVRQARYFGRSAASAALKSAVPVLGGSVLVFGSGLEIARLCLPYDPWYDEARHWRRVATKNGVTPSWWWGAYGQYQPMPFKQWSELVNAWLKRQEAAIDDGSHPGLKGPLANSPILATLNKNAKYLEVYTKLRESNIARTKALLDGELKDVNELNKAERIDLILEGKSPFVNPNYTKSHIQLGTFSIESDDEFDVAWQNFNPWDELKMETDYDIRLVPRWNWISEEDDEDKTESIA